MNKKPFFRMNFGALKLALLIVVILGALAVIGLDIAILAGAIFTDARVVAWVSLAASALVGAMVVVVLAGSGYSFCEDHICVSLGFFKDKLPYDKITELKRNGDSGTYYIIMGDVQTGTNVRVDISASANDEFVKELRKHLPTIPVETFVLPPKNKNK